MTQLLSVSLISQRDPRWADILLGRSGRTIGSHGCAIACLSMLGSYSQHAEPDSLCTVNKMLLSVGGYYSQNLLRWGIAHMLFPRLRYVGRIDIGANRPARSDEMFEITNRLDHGQPVIVYVDTSQAEPGLQQHFVIATGFDPDRNALTIHDPWHGDSGFIAPRYGRNTQEAVCGIILYDLLDDTPPRTFPALRPRHV